MDDGNMTRTKRTSLGANGLRLVVDVDHEGGERGEKGEIGGKGREGSLLLRRT